MPANIMVARIPALVAPLLVTTLAAAEPIRVHPDNPHYFLFRGKPTVLIGSNEHYGAVVNLDFDYDRYLEEIQSKGLNYARLFSGTYIEPAANMGSYWNIDDNTLGPASTRYVCPWQRSATPGFEGGGSRFDLSRFDPDYFSRLRDFVSKAGERGVVVELVFFCPFWKIKGTETPLPNMWARSPMKKSNNINGVGDALSYTTSGHHSVWDTEDNDGLTPYMDAMVAKVAQELAGFDNVIFQPCIEPYLGGKIMATTFEEHIIARIVEAERDLPPGRKHLISQSRNPWSPTDNNKHDVSVLTYDGAKPDLVASLYHLQLPVVEDEITYKGTADAPYRREGWVFIIGGGAGFNMLDLSFTPGKEDGSAIPSTIGGGGPALRAQLRILKDFIHGFGFLRMKPDNSIIKGGVPDQCLAQALVEPGRQYAIYLDGGRQANLALDLPTGEYRAEWVDPRTGEATRRQTLSHRGGTVVLASPPFAEDIALAIRGGSAP